MGCLECGNLDNIEPLHWLCNKCETKWIKIGEQVEEVMKNGKRIQTNRSKRSNSETKR